MTDRITPWQVILAFLVAPYLIVVVIVVGAVSFLRLICQEAEDWYRGCGLGERVGMGQHPQSRKVESCNLD